MAKKFKCGTWPDFFSLHNSIFNFISPFQFQYNVAFILKIFHTSHRESKLIYVHRFWGREESLKFLFTENVTPNEIRMNNKWINLYLTLNNKIIVYTDLFHLLKHISLKNILIFPENSIFCHLMKKKKRKWNGKRWLKLKNIIGPMRLYTFKLNRFFNKRQQKQTSLNWDWLSCSFQRHNICKVLMKVLVVVHLEKLSWIVMQIS